MIVQVQYFFKYMNAQCNVLNIGQSVLQVMTILSFVSRVLKNDIMVLKLVIVKNCNLSVMKNSVMQIQLGHIANFSTY